MPLYEYECAKDGRFELIRKFSDPPVEACPTCGEPVEKLLSSPAIQFKGSGWYITDYARKGSPDSKAGDSKSPDTKSGETKGGGSKASEAKGESKAASGGSGSKPEASSASAPASSGSTSATKSS